MIASYNRAVWPAQILAFALATALVWLALRPHDDRLARAGGRLHALALVAAWAWTGAVFHLQYFATINFVAPVYGALFLGQALLLTWTGVVRRNVLMERARGAVGLAAMGLLAYALVGYPAIAAIAGEGVASTRVVGLDPGPTAVFTLGLLLLARGRTPLHLVIVPLVWSLVAGVSAWMLAIPEDLVLPVLGLGALALIIRKNISRGET